MIVNGNMTRYVLDGLFIVLIGTFGWVANKADVKVEKHETRIQATELSNMEFKTDMKYVVKSLDEIKGNLNKLMQERKP